jgi:hypothetical protein
MPGATSLMAAALAAAGACVLFCAQPALAVCGYADCKSKALWTCSLHECTTRTIIDLHGASLWGTIPAVFGSMKALSYALELYSNQLTGTLPPSLGSLTLMSHYLGLSSNKFSGTVRVCVPACVCVRVRVASVCCWSLTASVEAFALILLLPADPVVSGVAEDAEAPRVDRH